MRETYELHVAGLTRHLPVCPLNDKVSIAGFVVLGDVELTKACARELLKIAPAHDLIITGEAKGITLAHEMSAAQGKKDYVIARKSFKLYMQNPLKVEVKSITTEKIQTLFIDEKDVNLMKGKRVLIVDDVISTGETLEALEALVRKAGGEIAGKMAVLAEGEAKDRKDILYLEPLPLIFHE